MKTNSPSNFDAVKGGQIMLSQKAKIKAVLVFSLLILLLVGLHGPLFAQESQLQDTSDLTEMSLEDLMNLEVVSASKEVEALRDAPSNITVITARQIKEWGMRDLKDVLRRVAGYYIVADRDEWVFAARGNVSDNNQSYLILMDGHRLNSIENFGPGQIIELPNDLSNVRQIEIIKGPGSVMWGSGGLAGIINIITKEAEDLGDHRVHTSVTIGENGTYKANFQFGRKVNEDASWIVMGAFATDDGELVRQSAATATFPQFSPGDFDDAAVDHPFGVYTTALERHDPGYMLQFKGKYDKFSLNAFAFNTQTFNRHFEADKGRENYLTTDKAFIEGTYKETVWDADVTWKMSSSINRAEYFPYEQGNPDNQSSLNILWRDRTFETSLDIRKQLYEVLILSGGADFAWSKAGPNQRLTSFNPDDPSAWTTGNWMDSYLDELNFGGYALLTAYLTEDLQVLAGSRFDYNDDRGEDPFNASPRVGSIWHASDNTTLKLLYNRGFLRPANFQVGGEGDVESEIMDQVDLIWMQRLGKVNLTSTAYWQKLEGLINILSGADYTGFANAGDYESKGLELEISAPLVGNGHEIWANASFSEAEGKNYPPTTGLSDDGLRVELNRRRVDGSGDLLSYPKVYFNVGGTFRFLNKKLFVSPAVRYVGEATYRTAPPIVSLDEDIYDEVGPFTYVDLNMGYEPTESFGVYVGVYNLTDETDETHLSIWNGTIGQYGRYVEVKAVYRF